VKTYWGSGGITARILTSALQRHEWSASRPDRFTSCTHSIGRWVGSTAGLDAVAKRKISHHCSLQELNPGRPARSLVKATTF